MNEHPARMDKEERLQEVADILSNAVIRLKQRKLRKNKHIPLDSSPERSVYGTHDGGEKT